MSIVELGAQLRSGHCDSAALVARALESAHGNDFGAFVDVFPAIGQARAADRELAEGHDRGPLHGIPVAVKDNIDVAGAFTRCGTAGLGHRPAERDAAVVERLRAAGAVLIGKTRMHELAWGMTTPGCVNPRDGRSTAGGSSAGSGAAVAAGTVPLALGTDTGGSVRNPAALCSVFGVKTASGQLPMSGIAPMAQTQDTVGVLGTTAEDCRLGLAALGAHERPRAVRTVGRIVDAWAGRVHPDIAADLDGAADSLRRNGVEVRDVVVPHSQLAPAAALVIMLAEGTRNWWPAPPGSIGPVVRDRLRLGARVSRADYEHALRVRDVVRASVDEVLGEVDALMLASCPVPPSVAGTERVPCAGREIPVESAHFGLTALASVAGLPAASVPAGAVSPAAQHRAGLQFFAADLAAVHGCAEFFEQQPRKRETGSGET